MFELSVACKYLIPRRRQLSVSIISLISVLVVALVVWLIVVFFSVTDGLEKSWIQKLTALTAPVRISPTDAYYHSYYYMVDSISESSQYSYKTIREKLEAPASDPYDPEMDQEIPSYWPNPDLDQTNMLKDPVKLVYASLDAVDDVPGLRGQDFELTATHIQLRLLRQTTVLHGSNMFGGTTQSALSYPAFLGNFEADNPHLEKILLPIEKQDVNNLFSLLGIANRNAMEEENESVGFQPDILRKRLHHFFEFVAIKELQARASGWNIPHALLSKQAVWEAYAILKDQHIVRIIVPQHISQLPSLKKSLEEQGLTIAPAKALVQEGNLSIALVDQDQPQPVERHSITLAGGSTFSAQLDPASVELARQIDDVRFDVDIFIQGTHLIGKVPYRGLEIAQAEPQSTTDTVSPWWVHRLHNQKEAIFELPKDPDIGEGIVLPKSFKDVGVMIGDRGTLSYMSPTASMLQEQQIPVYVAGFYDPGIIPIGGKFILASQEVTSLIRSSHQQDDKTAVTNGINVRFTHLNQADHVKAKLIQALKDKGISRYWNVETYREYEFTKEIMRELQSQKNLFMLIAVVIILVACSNIISMLVILVNDKKMEIGILRSMGASSKSIALIFGVSGAIIGVLGSVGGIVAAILTLKNLNALVALLSRLQGHDMFSSNLYGQVLPSELSFEALSFVLIATVCMSLLAGIVPAIKACLLRPSQILRSNGG